MRVDTLILSPVIEAVPLLELVIIKGTLPERIQALLNLAQCIRAAFRCRANILRLRAQHAIENRHALCPPVRQGKG
jgi:hypothetical protein